MLAMTARAYRPPAACASAQTPRIAPPDRQAIRACKQPALRAGGADPALSGAMDDLVSPRPLSALDAAFLGLESRDVPFVHASILAFDRPLALDAVRAHVGGVLAGVPRYRQRIVRGRVGTAAWVDDPVFSIERHILATTVPAPGGARELEELCAQLLADPLPAEHPPWRVWVVGGLDGGRGALISLFHHALVDGVGGFQLLEHVLSAPATAATPPAATPPAEPPPAPRRSRLAAVRRLVARSSLAGLAGLLRDGLRPASQIGLNPRHTGPIRSVASHSVELATMQHIGHAHGATTNDVVLATVAGALQRLLRRRGIDPTTLDDVRTMVPVARHAKGSRATSGNQVAMLLTRLPVAILDPVERLRRVAATTRGLKRGGAVPGGDLLVALSDATAPVLLVAILKLSLRMRGFNLIVTNVPGPTRPLALIGARLTRIVPVVNLWPHVALGIAVASYAGTMTFGIQTDRAVIPDAGPLRDDLAAAFEELRAAILPGEIAPGPQRTPQRPMQGVTP
ncbi:MAG TPA: wax ester/triacylglycerol synthase family O-acyltransferase [Kofleriaceae bacterium]|nr:wax ester/triacylglycerol synthase family O-acyltransferase [Kofleriaceae bacterium]